MTFLLLAAQACKDDDNGGPDVPVYGQGIFIANEGPFQNGSGTVTFFDRNTGEVKQDIFAAANEGEPVGNILQSIHFFGEKAFLVVNNGGKVVVVNAETFEKEGEITGLAQPRYFLAVSGERAFVSQWGADGLTGSVAVVNLKTLTVERTVPTGSGPEQMLQIGNQLYVANSGGGFGGIDSTLAVIDLNSETVVFKITVGVNPNSLQQDKDGAVWVACSGFSDFLDPTNPLNAPGKLVKVENNAASLSIPLPEQAFDLVMNPSGDRIFYLGNNYGSSIFDLNINETAARTTPFMQGSFYAIGLDPVANTILAADAKDFQSNGEVRVFTPSGGLAGVIQAGIIPGSFWVN